jgi:hypothetical protein
LSNQEQDNEAPPFHHEGGAGIFDKPKSQEEVARQRREDEQHEFARSQVKTNKRLAWFTAALVFASFCTIAVGIWQASIYGSQLTAMRGQLDEMKRSGATSTDQMWRAVGNINWLAQSMDLSQKSTKRAMGDQTKAQLRAANVAAKQLEDFENVQAAHLTIENISGVREAGNNWKVSFILANRGNSLPTVWETGSDGTGEYTEDQLAEEMEREVRPLPGHGGFDLGQGKEQPFTVEFGADRWYWSWKFAYLDIFGQEHPPLSVCLIPFKSRVIPCQKTRAQIRKEAQENQKRKK